jgi:uncharacterized membrane protein (DUF373 family)
LKVHVVFGLPYFHAEVIMFETWQIVAIVVVIVALGVLMWWKKRSA